MKYENINSLSFYTNINLRRKNNEQQLFQSLRNSVQSCPRRGKRNHVSSKSQFGNQRPRRRIGKSEKSYFLFEKNHLISNRKIK